MNKNVKTEPIRRITHHFSRYYFFIFLILGVHIHALSQNEYQPSKISFKTGYMGNVLFDNGLFLGSEYLLKRYERSKVKNNGTRITMHDLSLNLNLGYSTNFTLQTDNSLHLVSGMSWRRTSYRRWQFNLEANPIGYYRSFLPETYEVIGDEVSEVKLAGRSYYAPSFVIGIGRLREKEKLNRAWFVNLSIAYRMPYNGGGIPFVGLQYGYRFNFKKNK